MFGRRNEPVEFRIMWQGMRQAGRRMAVHNALAPLQPNKVNPATGRTNKDTRDRAKARKAAGQ